MTTFDWLRLCADYTLARRQPAAERRATRHSFSRAMQVTRARRLRHRYEPVEPSSVYLLGQSIPALRRPGFPARHK